MSEASLLVDGLNARIYEKPRRILLPLSNSALAFKFRFKHLIENCDKLIQGGVFFVRFHGQLLRQTNSRISLSGDRKKQVHRQTSDKLAWRAV